MMESGSAASTTSAFHAAEGPGKRPSSERHSGDHSRKQSINGVQDAGASSSSRGSSSNN
uniref:Uncharacterized protein n=1 Tax=Globisporangium ultimum (strain ATCC 200006 / CBS 805.95 / DAOM BR144) TaxID=431595 RepID=K3WUQ2_GLOUD